MNKKGQATWLIASVIFLAVITVTLLVLNLAGVSLSLAPAAIVAVDYDGEFDDAYLAVKGNYYSDFTEGTDCNVTSNVLGASGYTNCIYDTSPDMNSITRNSTEYRFDLVIDIDNDVENMEIEGQLQNTGTGQAKDDIVIKVVELWTYEDSDETVLIYEVPIDNEDGEFEGETGVLVGGDYVLHLVLKTKLIAPEFSDGDDIMKIQFDLTTDGDVDAARILLEE